MNSRWCDVAGDVEPISLHAVFSPECTPCGSGGVIAGYKMIHVLFWYTIDIDAIPESGKDINDIVGIPFCTSSNTSCEMSIREITWKNAHHPGF